jgi:hypothetical protein
VVGKHGTRNCRHPTTTPTTEPELGHFVPKHQHSATTLNDYVNNQLGGRASPNYPGKYFFFMCFIIFEFSLYAKKDA